ncbi:transposase [Streptomyces sp. NPDC005181]|uniref:transposase n=1 Tax=Streptomyces sp. NPDC005181 TaxID=3156869 RepID=UPI0033BEB0AB
MRLIIRRSKIHPRDKNLTAYEKKTGLRRMPSRDFAINHAWCQAVALAVDLTAWLQQLALDGEESRAEPDTVRLRILDIPARLVRGARRRILKLADDWPWSSAVANAYTRVQALPTPD